MPARNRSPSLVHRLRVEVHAAWLAARDRRTPLSARLFGLFLTAYALSPIDIIPDFVPIIGLLDEAILIPLGLWLFRRMVPGDILAECRIRAEQASARPRSRWGILIVLAIWATVVLLFAWLVVWPFE